MEITLTKNNYNEIVNQNKKPVLIDFWATWCGPCMMVAPIVEEIANERDDIAVCKVNVDEEPELAEKFQVRFIPMLVAMKDGKSSTQQRDITKRKKFSLFWRVNHENQTQ